MRVSLETATTNCGKQRQAAQISQTICGGNSPKWTAIKWKNMDQRKWVQSKRGISLIRKNTISGKTTSIVKTEIGTRAHKNQPQHNKWKTTLEERFLSKCKK